MTDRAGGGRGRTLAPLAMTTAMALVVTGSGAAAAPADDEPAGAVSVSGTSTLMGSVERGTTTLEDGIVRTRGTKLITIERASDPRVNGRALITLDVDSYPEAGGGSRVLQVRYGTMRLVNEEGTWEGSFAGRLTETGFTQTYWLEGTGAYDGFTYVVTAGGDGPVWESAGLIYPGRPPGGLPAGARGPRSPGPPPPIAGS